MLHPKAFKFRQAEYRPNNYIGALPDIDKKRATAVLVRQSKSGADTAMAESRETQLGLQEYSALLYGDDEPHVELYDEGAGVSGQKRIDQRAQLDRLYRDLVAFQDKMREAYGYIEGHVKHMLQCKQNKADKGGYDGRLLPPGLAVNSTGKSIKWPTFFPKSRKKIKKNT